MLILITIIFLAWIIVYLANKARDGKDFIGRMKSNNTTSKGDPYYMASGRNVFVIRCNSAVSLDFSVNLEKWYHRLFKKLGVAVESQVGDEKFDSRLYLAGNDKMVLDVVKNSPLIQKNLLEIADFCKSNYLNFKELCFTRGAVNFYAKDRKRKISSEEVGEKLVPLILEIYKQFEERLGITPRPRDKFHHRSVKILAVICSSLFVGMGDSIYETFNKFPQTFDVALLVKDSFFLGGFLFLLSEILTVFLLGKTSKFPKIFISIILFGFISFVLGGGAVLRSVNIDFDQSPVTFVNTVISEKQLTKGRRRSRASRTYTLHLSRNQSDYGTIRVDEATYYALSTGDALCLKQRPGYLGYRWIEDVYFRVCPVGGNEEL